MDYSAPAAYDRLIAKRYRPIAESLVEAARLHSGERVLEIGAGTGLVTKLAAKQVQPGGTLCATDLSRGMLSLARKGVREPGVSFVVADYAQPFPFLDESFDVVLSGDLRSEHHGAAGRGSARSEAGRPSRADDVGAVLR